MARNRALSLSCDWEKIINEGDTRQSIPSSRFSMCRNKKDLEEDFEPKFEKSNVDFCTESSYIGQWDSLGMSGFGTYVFPHGVEYEGQFKDGMFHGEGTLIYPMGQKIEGAWIDGVMTSFTFRFADGLEHGDNWEYCTMPDRRFYIEICEGLKPAGREYLTNEQPTRQIPEGGYDTGRGFFDPKTKCITGALDSQAVYKRIQEANMPKMVKVVGDVYERPQVNIATETDEQWIVKNCRKAWDEATGYEPELYERWVSGRAADFYIDDLEPSTLSSDSYSSEDSSNAPETSDSQLGSEDSAQVSRPERDDITKIWVDNTDDI